MALIKCSECGREVSNKAKQCPKCGAKILVKKNNKNALESDIKNGNGVDKAIIKHQEELNEYKEIMRKELDEKYKLQLAKEKIQIVSETEEKAKLEIDRKVKKISDEKEKEFQVKLEEIKKQIIKELENKYEKEYEEKRIIYNGKRKSELLKEKQQMKDTIEKECSEKFQQEKSELLKIIDELSRKEEKIKDNNKKKNSKFSVILAVICLISLLGNVAQFAVYQSDKKSEQIIQDNNTVVNDTNSDDSESNAVENKQESDARDKEENSTNGPNESKTNSSHDTVASQGEKQISLGENVRVTTEYGEYDIVIENVHICDWMERGDKEAEGLECILIEADISNLDYKDPYNEAFWLDHMLNVLDDENYTLDTLGYSYDDGSYMRSPKIANGARAKVVVPYKINASVNSVKININNQYIVTTDIER